MSAKHIQSIERAMAILETVARDGGSAKLSRIAEETGLGKTTAHNILTTLGALGYVRRRVGDTRYHLGGRIMNLARITGDDSSLRHRLRPALEAIAARSGETVYLGVPSGDEVYYLDMAGTPPVPEAYNAPGARDHLEGSAIGLVFLAFMPGLRERVLLSRADALPPLVERDIAEVERLGFGLDLESHRSGLHCVAIPWREEGEVRASLGLCGPAARLPKAKLAELAWMMVREIEKV
ncbi:IclR family transcriptional regulator [Sphingomonas abietis]|uniref:IclR family transcriptional regulator n=1 Tax=Sphingomonas abietis TaxID=3012344 RepID=A0ABY7NIH2_9SPHN|nr:IclR family transcriptional regulator [Sphingomonas abietis]WBO21325.1 IclR family transcriptional regulator [Sphingomonas abietis]